LNYLLQSLIGSSKTEADSGVKFTLGNKLGEVAGRNYSVMLSPELRHIEIFMANTSAWM